MCVYLYKQVIITTQSPISAKHLTSGKIEDNDTIRMLKDFYML